MKNPRQKSLGLLVSLVAVASALAGSHYFKPKSQIAEIGVILPAEKQTQPIVLPPAAPVPQTGLQISSSVVAGGGGASQGGSLKIEGTIGQSAAGTQMTGGQFSQVGGFWPASAAEVSPTPTPSPTATPTPTPPPMAVPLLIFAAADNPNEAAAIDSVTFVRGPFKTHTDVNFSADHQTRVLLFTTALGLIQSDVSKVTVTAAGISLTVESVGPLFGLPGRDASYIVVRLPDGLPPGNLPLIVIANGVQSSNSPTLGISPP
ncbi:MAG TPA: hypothetical protein VIU65_11765 [Pyrinomonadaceae bacterium]